MEEGGGEGGVGALEKSQSSPAKSNQPFSAKLSQPPNQALSLPRWGAKWGGRWGEAGHGGVGQGGASMDGWVRWEKTGEQVGVSMHGQGLVSKSQDMMEHPNCAEKSAPQSKHQRTTMTTLNKNWSHSSDPPPPPSLLIPITAADDVFANADRTSPTNVAG